MTLGFLLAAQRMKTSHQRADMEAEEIRSALVAHLDSHLDFDDIRPEFPNVEKKKNSQTASIGSCGRRCLEEKL